MKQILRTIVASFVLLFSIHGAQAASMPMPNTPNLPYHEFGTITVSDSASLVQPDIDPNIVWFEFYLDFTQEITLDTFGSTTSTISTDVLDTMLAVYDILGNLQGQNDDCGGDLESCLTLNLADGTYLAGVTQTADPFGFAALWELEAGYDFAGPLRGDGQVSLNITVSPVPVPAAFWLFSTALIGFVGMSRRRKVA
jgi:hypothetical protein